MALTEQQQDFVNEFLKRRCKHGAAKAAAIAAGYSEKTASVIASKLLAREDVKAYLKERRKALEDELREEFFFDAVAARETMQKIMNDPGAKDYDRITAAKDMLDRAGFKATDKVEVSTEETSLNKLGSILEQLKK